MNVWCIWVTCMCHTYEIWMYGAYGLPVCVTHIRYASMRHDLFNMTWRVNSFTSSAIARCVWRVSDGLPLCVTHMRYESMRHDWFNMTWRVRLNHDSIHILSNCGLGVVHMGWVTCMCHTYEIWIYEIQHDTTRSCEAWLIHIFSNCALRVVHIGWVAYVCHTYETWLHETGLIHKAIWHVRVKQDSFASSTLACWVASVGLAAYWACFRCVSHVWDMAL